MHVLSTLRKQLYIAERVVGSIPIMDETTEGAALVVHVVLYICFVSVAIDTLNAWTRGTPEWSAFWGAISPYSMLYTSGKCIARLSASGMSCTVLAMAYIVARVRVCAPEAESRIWANIDYVANRLVVRAIQSGLASLGAVPLHVALSAFFIAFSMTRDGGDMASNATMVSFTSVLTLSLAQCAANAAPTPTTMMLASLSTIATLAAMRTKWDWPGKVACLGFSTAWSAHMQRAGALHLSNWHEILVLNL